MERVIKEINVDEMLEIFKKDQAKTSQDLEILFNGKKISVFLDYDNFEEDFEDIKTRLETLKKIIENSEEWEEKAKNAAVEYFFEDLDDFPYSDFDDEDIPGLVEDLEEIMEKEEAQKIGEGVVTESAFKKILSISVIYLCEKESLGIGFGTFEHLIFGGHLLVVNGDFNGNFTDGDMAG